MNIRTTSRMATTTAALALSGLTLTACGGSGGEYIQDVDKHVSPRLGSLVVDGDTLTYTEFKCDGSVDDDKTSVGTISDDRAKVVWTQEGRWSNSDQVTTTDDAVSLGRQTFVLRDSDQGKALSGDHRQQCENHNS